MVYIPGISGSTLLGCAVAGSSNGNSTLIGTGTHVGGDSFNIDLSESLTTGNSVLIVVDAELASATTPDFSLYPEGATQGNFSYRFVGASAGTGVNPRVARIAASGAIGMHVMISGVLSVNADDKLIYTGQFTNSTLAQYGQAYFYETTGTHPTIDRLVFLTTVSGSLAAGSKVKVFKLW